jgi:hypothetical protein
MFNHNITRHLDIDIAMAPVAAGTGDTQTGITIDTAGFESFVFMVYFGTITSTAVTTVKLQAGALANASDMADVTNATVSVPDTGDNLGWLSVEIHRPTKRYWRVAVVRATANAVINGAIVILGRSAIQPPAIGATMGNVTPTVLVSVP